MHSVIFLNSRMLFLCVNISATIAQISIGLFFIGWPSLTCINHRAVQPNLMKVGDLQPIKFGSQNPIILSLGVAFKSNPRNSFLIFIHSNFWLNIWLVWVQNAKNSIFVFWWPHFQQSRFFEIIGRERWPKILPLTQVVSKVVMHNVKKKLCGLVLKPRQPKNNRILQSKFNWPAKSLILIESVWTMAAEI